jgi:hypothetical protein
MNTRKSYTQETEAEVVGIGRAAFRIEETGN